MEILDTVLWLNYFYLLPGLITLLTWVPGVLLIEAIDWTEHEVQHHLTVCAVHTGCYGDRNNCLNTNSNTHAWMCTTMNYLNTVNPLKQSWTIVTITETNHSQRTVEKTYWFHLYWKCPHCIPLPETCSAPLGGKLRFYLWDTKHLTT